MSEHFNGLTPAEDERLALLIEECSECVQAACKILRHGYESCDPTASMRWTNRQALERELGDVQAAILLLTRAADLCAEKIDECTEKKLRAVRRWMHHQQGETNEPTDAS